LKTRPNDIVDQKIEDRFARLATLVIERYGAGIETDEPLRIDDHRQTEFSGVEAFYGARSRARQITSLVLFTSLDSAQDDKLTATHLSACAKRSPEPVEGSP
jgi:hypothetical protein